MSQKAFVRAMSDFQRHLIDLIFIKHYLDSYNLSCQITTQTLDPFSGVLYVQPSSAIRRGHQGPSHCRVEGRGRHEVSLDISPGQCGWRREGSLVSLNLYMQYDPHVQQVLDEQLTVECDMATRTGSVVDMGVLETGNQVASVPLTASMGTGSSWAEEDLVLVRDQPQSPLQNPQNHRLRLR